MNDLGLAASNINGIIAFVYNIVDVILYIGAAILGMSGLLKYRLHRQNPQQVPLSTPVTELAIAGVLVLLAFLVQLSTSYEAVENPRLPNTSVTTTTPAPQPAPTPQQKPQQRPQPPANSYPY
jgi:hypothetical protein